MSHTQQMFISCSHNSLRWMSVVSWWQAPSILWLLPPLKVSLTSSSRCASRRRRRVCFFKLYFLVQNISNIQKRREILKFIPNTHHSASTIMDLGPHLFLWSRFLGQVYSIDGVFTIDDYVKVCMWWCSVFSCSFVSQSSSKKRNIFH